MKKQENKELDLMKFLSKLYKGTIDKDFTSIRFIKKEDYNFWTGNKKITYGWFEIKNGIIVDCERGYSQYKNIKLINCQKAYDENENIRMRNIFTGNYC